MPRRRTATLEQDAVAALLEALFSIGITAHVVWTVPPTGERRADAVVEIAGQRFGVEVKSVITAAQGELLASGAAREVPSIVVANRVASDAKRSLRAAGVNYFDRRGELRIVSAPLFVDVLVAPALPMTGVRGGPLDSQVAKEVATACLLTPDQPHGIRGIARYIDRAPSAVSSAMSRLRDDGLVTSAGEAMIPDLFHALADVWRRSSVLLASLPGTGPVDAGRLRLGLGDAEDSVGWALTGTRAAASWGMPIVAAGDYPPDFYVPCEPTLRAARSHLREVANPAARGCTVAVAPVRLACLRRVDRSRATGERWPVANHVVVALDIAQDRARGLEALEQWQPEGIVRAW